MGRATFPKCRTYEEQILLLLLLLLLYQENDGDKKENEKTDWRGTVGYFLRDIFRKRKEQGDSGSATSGLRILFLAICRKARNNCEPPQQVSCKKKTVPSDTVLGTNNLNIRWHNNSWHLGLMIMFMLLPVYTVINLTWENGNDSFFLCLCLCLCHSRFTPLLLMLMSQCKPGLMSKSKSSASPATTTATSTRTSQICIFSGQKQ